MKRNDNVQKLMTCRADITGKDPDLLLQDFITIYGPNYEDYILAAMVETIYDQNEIIYGLKQYIVELQVQINKIKQDIKT